MPSPQRSHLGPTTPTLQAHTPVVTLQRLVREPLVLQAQAECVCVCVQGGGDGRVQCYGILTPPLCLYIHVHVHIYTYMYMSVYIQTT